MIADGSMLLGPSVARRLVEVIALAAATSRPELQHLTRSEREVCALVARGCRMLRSPRPATSRSRR